MLEADQLHEEKVQQGAVYLSICGNHPLWKLEPFLLEE